MYKRKLYEVIQKKNGQNINAKMYNVLSQKNQKTGKVVNVCACVCVCVCVRARVLYSFSHVRK